MLTLKILLRIITAICASMSINSLAGCFSVWAEEKRNLAPKQPEPIYTTLKNVFIILTGIAISFTTNENIYLVFDYSMLLCTDIIMIMDFRHRIIPNQVLLAMFIIKTILTLPTVFGIEGFLPFNNTILLDSILGLVLMMVLFAAPALTTGGIGLGDVKMALTVGYCLGIKGGLVSVALCGLIVLIYVISQPYVFCSSKLTTVSERFRQAIPFGVTLGMAMMAVIVMTNTAVISSLSGVMG